MFLVSVTGLDNLQIQANIRLFTLVDRSQKPIDLIGFERTHFVKHSLICILRVAVQHVCQLINLGL